MHYSLIGTLALLILIIANHDILLNRSERNSSKAKRTYYIFLLCVMAYYVTDILWGIFDSMGFTRALFIDTEVYFLAMAAGILMWTGYVNAYLEKENIYKTILRYAGIVFFVLAAGITLTNLFAPVVFWYDGNGAYHAGVARHIILIFQVVMFLLTSIYEIGIIARIHEAEISRHLAICLFGLIMVAALTAQLFFPLMPLYAAGYMLGTSLLHTFVIDSEKEEYRKDLEASLEREKKQLDDLSTAWDLAYTDALTGVKSKLAYSEKAAKMNEAIAQGSAGAFAVVSFDLNRLKHINDTLGHDIGDSYIRDACQLICEVFKHSPVFRVGGDEFATILEGSDYFERKKLMADFDAQIDENNRKGRVVVAAGMEEFLPGTDNSIERVFKRADARMYVRKEALKQF